MPPSCDVGVFPAVKDPNSKDNDAICEALAKVLSTNRTLRSLKVTSMFCIFICNCDARPLLTQASVVGC